MGILAVYLKFLRPIELTHFFLFSSLGWFSVSAFGIRKGALMVILIATGDEILQHFLPGRVGDLHDILINNTSGLVGVFLGSNKEKNQTP
jgi:VanZ family protein